MTGLYGELHTATVVALQDTSAIELTADTLAAVLLEFPEVVTGSIGRFARNPGEVR